MTRKAALFLNLGSPDSTEIKDVRQYLKEFLSDPRVLDSSPLARWFVLNFCILPSRPKQTAHAYKQIWTNEGSPLIQFSFELQENVTKNINIPIELAMRYGNPSMAEVASRLKDQNIEELFIMPLYPHYAMSSYETAWVHALQELASHAPHIKTTTLQPFYKDPQYIEALVEAAKPSLDEGYDRLLFSFHGVPQKHLRKSDPSHAHCLCRKDCCYVDNPAHATCYKHQCLQTVKHFVEKASIPEEKYSVSFQSRLGRDPWLEPYTDKVLEALPHQGVKKLLVICPSFVADCLETLEEIAMSGKETFLKAGGESFYQIPCLNNHPAWIHFLIDKIQSWT